MLLLEAPEWASAEEAVWIQQINHNWFNLQEAWVLIHVRMR